MAPAGQSATPLLALDGGLLVRRLEALPDAESAFVHLYGASANAFWLDGSGAAERGRFSFIGDGEGPLGAVAAYDLSAGQLRIERGGRVELREESVFDFLARAQVGTREGGGSRDAGVVLPFDFDCGLVGYLGYELKAECDAAAGHRADAPDAAFVLADRLIAFDHRERCTYLLARVDRHSELHRLFDLAGGEVDAAREGERWIEETSERLAALPALGQAQVGGPPASLTLRRSRRRYLADVAACKDYLAAGHSYEICLTNQASGKVEGEPLDLYRALRRANPAPFSAYLRFGDLAVLSSSPERFLSVDREGAAEARPIKGTARRDPDPREDARLAAALAADPKSRAENVTIVDLVRNDLGRVCEPGSVEVPELMRVETYATVHQLVSCVRGLLRPGVAASEAVRACFPPGSMTGAPKLRTMEILDQLEGAARGVYSGAIGWFGLGGACDLSVAIRTIVLDGGRASVGAGGAVVADSDADAELAEMLLKARAPLAALGPGASISFASQAAPDNSARRAPFPISTS